MTRPSPFFLPGATGVISAGALFWTSSQASGPCSAPASKDCRKTASFQAQQPLPLTLSASPASLLRLPRKTGSTPSGSCAGFPDRKSTLLGARGAGLTYGSACASGLIALGEGFLRIRHGLAGTVLVHAGDSRLSSGALLGYAKAHTLSHHLSPDASSLPFDRDRRGFVPGEGGAAFVLEERSAAQKRGARILAEITGYAATLDGGALTAPDPKGIQAEKAVRRALAMADLTPGDIDFVSAHGTGTGLNDAMEAGLLARVFPGKDGPAVTAFKSWTGHLASACGAVETALAIICAQERITPPVRGLRHPLTDSLRFVLPGTAPAPDVFKPGSCGLVENFGFGGQNAALCLRVEA